MRRSTAITLAAAALAAALGTIGCGSSTSPSTTGSAALLVPFLSLSQDACPLTTGNLVAAEQSLQADHAASKVPHFHGKLNPKLYKFLDQLGRQHLKQPPRPDWTPADLLQALVVSVGPSLPAAPVS